MGGPQLPIFLVWLEFLVGFAFLSASLGVGLSSPITLSGPCFCGLYTGCVFFFFKENGRMQSKHQILDTRTINGDSG